MARSGRVDQNQSSSDSMSQARPAPKRAPTTMIQKGKEYRLGSLLRILIRQPSCRVQREVILTGPRRWRRAPGLLPRR